MPASTFTLPTILLFLLFSYSLEELPHVNSSLSDISTPNNDTFQQSFNLDPTKQKLLMKYIMDGDLEGVKKAESLGANLDYGTSYEAVNLPLYTALGQHYRIVNLATMGGAAYAKKYPKMLPVVDYLFSKSTKLNVCNGAKQYCIINQMCMQSKKECKKAVEVWNLDMTNLETNLFTAKHQQEALSYLMDKGMNSSSGDNPLAAIGKYRDNPDLLRKILDGGASGRINEMTSRRNFPVLEAVKSGHVEILQILLEYNADPTFQCDQAIQEAIYIGNQEMVEILLKAGVNPNETCNKSMKKGMLDYALNSYKANKTNIVDILIEYGAN